MQRGTLMEEEVHRVREVVHEEREREGGSGHVADGVAAQIMYVAVYGVAAECQRRPCMWPAGRGGRNYHCVRQRCRVITSTRSS